MKTLAILLLLIGGAVAAAWLGGETWLARKAQAMIAEDPRVEASQVTPLREIDRISRHYTGKDYPVRDSARVNAWIEVERWHGWGAAKQR